MESQIRTFTFNNETVFLVPGRDLPKNEIMRRLINMNINADPSKNKEDLERVYEIALNNYYNKLSIINQLRQDTEYYFRKKNINRREYLDDNLPYTTNQKIMFNRDAPLNDRQRQNTEFNDTQNSSISPSFLRQFLSFLNNHKMDILENALLLFLIFAFEVSLEEFSRNNFFIREILKDIRRSITQKGIIIGFLFYILIRYILGFFYVFLRAGVFAFLILIYRS